MCLGERKRERNRPTDRLRDRERVRQTETKGQIHIQIGSEGEAPGITCTWQIIRNNTPLKNGIDFVLASPAIFSLTHAGASEILERLLDM